MSRKDKKKVGKKQPSKTQQAKVEKKEKLGDFLTKREERIESEGKQAISEMTFKEKLSAISQAVETLPVTGMAKDGSFWYDQAAEVFPIFNGLFAKYHILPLNMVRSEHKIEAVGITPVLFYKAWYELKDITSDEVELIYGESESNNWPFAVDSARTWAMKRALKDRFLAGCPQPDNDENTPHVDNNFGPGVVEYQRQAEEAGIMAGQLSPKQAIAELDEHFKGDKKPEPPKPIELVEPAATEGMSRPGTKQLECIKMAHKHYEAACALTTPPLTYFKQATRNNLWGYFKCRWPKSKAEVDKFIEDISYLDMFKQ